MTPNPIVKYLVKRVGRLPKSEHRVEFAAHRAAHLLNPEPYRVYARHADGSITGPYEYVPKQREP